MLAADPAPGPAITDEAVRGHGPGPLTAPTARLGVLLALAATFQVVQGVVSVRTMALYERSYWYVDYEQGFTRRGLAGAAVRAITGRLATATQVEVLQWSITAALLVALALLVGAAVATRHAALALAATALCCSPFGFDFVVAQRRPEQIGFLVVVVYGLVLVRRPRALLATAIVAGLALAVSVLVADSVALACTPWIAAITVLRARAAHRRFGVPTIAATVPAIVAAVVSTVWGRLDAVQIARLERAAARQLPALRDPAGTVFAFLGDGAAESLHHVADHSKDVYVGSILVALVLFALVAIVMCGARRWHRRGVAHDRDAATTTLIITVAAAVVGLGALMALGTDWLRWFAIFGLMATVTATLARLYGPSDHPTREGVRWIAVALIASYLLWLAPIPDNIGIRDGIRFLLMLPR